MTKLSKEQRQILSELMRELAVLAYVWSYIDEESCDEDTRAEFIKDAEQILADIATLKKHSTYIPHAVVEYIEAEMENYEYSDNMRVCELVPDSATKTTKAYEIARRRGCCASVDYQTVVFNNKTYVYGFNYGH